MLKPYPLPKLIKQNKFLFCVLLFTCIAIFVPQSASAAWWSAKDWGTAIVNGIASLVLVYIFWLPLLFIVVFSTLTKVLLSAAIAFATIGTSYTNSPAVQIGWPLVRDLANMFVVLGFVIIGIATILRFKDYEAKKLLPSLIIAALLINFSRLICGIFIDASNTFMTFFFGKVNAISSWVPAVSDLATLYSNIAENNILDFAPKLIGMIFFYLIAALVNLLYFFLILGRVLALWMLVILSPLAFVCYVFPATKPIWQMWWKNFFQWCIIIIPAGLFYYIGAKMVSDSASKPGGSIGELIGSGDWVVWVSNAISVILVPALFLIIGFLVSLQFSAMGASVILNAVSKNKGKIMGATAGMADKLSGGRLSSAAQTVKGNVSRIGERMGLIKTGTTRNTEADRVEKEAKLMAIEYASAKATGNTATVEKIRGWSRTARGTKGAAAVRVVMDAKDLHKAFDNGAGGIDTIAAGQRMSYAESVGAKDVIKDAQKMAPRLAERHQPTLDEITSSLNPATGANFTPAEAPREAKRKKHAELGVPDLRDIHQSQMDEDLLEDVKNRTFDRAGLEFKSEQHEKLRRMVEDYATNPANALRAKRQAMRTQFMALEAAAGGRTPQSNHLREKYRNLGRNIITVRRWNNM